MLPLREDCGYLVSNFLVRRSAVVNQSADSTGNRSDGRAFAAPGQRADTGTCRRRPSDDKGGLLLTAVLHPVAWSGVCSTAAIGDGGLLRCGLATRCDRRLLISNHDWPR